MLPASLAFLGALGGPALADSLYDVAKVSIDTTAKDAVAARDMGMAEAEMRAIKIVLKRLVPVSVQDQLPELKREDVEGMVNGVSIRSEQNSTTRYIATLDVSFNEQAVKQLLIDQGIPYSESRAPSISILPLIVEGDSVKGEGKGWREAWEDLDFGHSVTPATILRPRSNLDAAAIKAVLAGDVQALETMQADYGYGPLVLAVGEVADGKFVTRLAGTDGVGAINYEGSDDIAGSAKEAAAAAAETAFGILENRWKVTQTGGTLPSEAAYEEGAQEPGPGQGPAAPADVPRNVVALVEFSGLKDWQEIRTRLMQVAGIQGLEVNSLSARAASITFDYAGPLGRMQTELGQNGFALDERDGTFVLRSR